MTIPTWVSHPVWDAIHNLFVAGVVYLFFTLGRSLVTGEDTQGDSLAPERTARTVVFILVLATLLGAIVAGGHGGHWEDDGTYDHIFGGGKHAQDFGEGLKVFLVIGSSMLIGFAVGRRERAMQRISSLWRGIRVPRQPPGQR